MSVTRHLALHDATHATIFGMPLGNRYAEQTCSIANALEIVGERWTLLIVRDILLGRRRFDELQSSLGIARNILQTRLEHLVATDVLERRPYSEHPPRHEYFLTEKGLDLWPAVMALMQWGDRHAVPEGGPPVLVTHRDCGGAVDEHRLCERCGARLGPRDVTSSRRR